MFNRSSFRARRPRRAAAPHSARRRTVCETLEHRTLLTSTLFLDFGDNFPAGGLDMTVLQLRNTFGSGGLQGPDLTDDGYADANTLTFTGTQALVNFDYDGSGAANAADYTTLRANVLALAQRYYAPFDVNVQIAPALTNDTDANYLNGIINTLSGGAAANGERDGWAFIATVTSGGASVGNTASLNGTSAGVDIGAANARDDTNLTFADVVLGNINATGSDADTRLAYTAAHEGGHDFGMRHTNWGTYFPSGTTTSSSGNAATDADLALISASDLVVASAPAANRTNFVFNTRWDLTRGDTNNGGSFNLADTENHYNRLANGGNLGLATGGPAYVTGTGAFDLITITPAAAPGMADVTVEAHRDNSFANQIGTDTTYQVPVGNILVEAGASQDRINISPLLGGTVRVRGMAGNDDLVVSGAGGIAGTYTPNTASVVGLDDITSFGGTLTAGATTIVVEEFEPAGSITVSGFASFTVATGGGSDVVNDNTPAAGQTRLSGTVGGVAFIPLTYSGVTNLAINTGDGDDGVTLAAAPAAGLSTLAVNGGAGADTLTLDFNPSNPVPTGGLDFDGGAGADTGVDLLVLRDGTFASQTYTATNSSSGTIALSGSGLITYTNLSPIDDSLAVGNMVFNATASGETIQLEDGPSGRSRIRSATGTFELLDFVNKSNVTVNALGGANVVNLTATNTPAGLTTLTVNGGAAVDRFNVTTTLSGVATTLNGDGADDVFTIDGTGAGTTLAISGGAGSDTVQFNSTGDGSAVTVDAGVDADTVFMIGTGAGATVTADGGDGADFFGVAGSGDGSTVTLNGGAGNDLLRVSGTSLGGGGALFANGDGDDDSFEIISSAGSPISVNGGTGNDTLKMDGQARTYVLTAAAFTAAGQKPVGYQLVELLDLTAGTFTVTGPVGPNVRVHGAGGPATVNGTGMIAGSLAADAGGTVAPGVGGPGKLGAGNATLNAGSTFSVDLNGMAAADHDTLNVTGSVNLNNADLTGTVGAATLPGDEFVIIRNDLADPVVGQFAQGFMVTIGGQKFTIDYAFVADPDGFANDVALIRYGAELGTDPCDPSKMALYVSATSADDTVTVLPFTGNSRLSVVIANGSFTDEFGPFDFKGHVIVMGQAGNDLLTTEQVPSRDVLMYGNAGNDTLRTGNNNGTLLGNAGDDLLVGGNARDLLIGGSGADTLAGDNAGDILVAASTTYDVTGALALANRQALCEIMQTWRNGGRQSSLLNAATVNDDSEVDILTGGNGEDWFIVDLNDITDRAKREVVLDL